MYENKHKHKKQYQVINIINLLKYKIITFIY